MPHNNDKQSEKEFLDEDHSKVTASCQGLHFQNARWLLLL